MRSSLALGATISRDFTVTADGFHGRVVDRSMELDPADSGSLRASTLRMLPFDLDSGGEMCTIDHVILRGATGGHNVL
jgi:hypothetical protein